MGKEDNDWVKKCMEYEVEGSKPRGRPKRTWLEVVRKEVNVSSGTGSPGLSRTKGYKTVVCAYV